MSSQETTTTGQCCQATKTKRTCHTQQELGTIAERAYFKWLDDGAPQGSDGKTYWFEAEQELTKADVTCVEVVS